MICGFEFAKEEKNEKKHVILLSTKGIGLCD